MGFLLNDKRVIVWLSQNQDILTFHSQKTRANKQINPALNCPQDTSIWKYFLTCEQYYF